MHTVVAAYTVPPQLLILFGVIMPCAFGVLIARFVSTFSRSGRELSANAKEACIGLPRYELVAWAWMVAVNAVIYALGYHHGVVSGVAVLVSFLADPVIAVIVTGIYQRRLRRARAA